MDIFPIHQLREHYPQLFAQEGLNTRFVEKNTIVCGQAPCAIESNSWAAFLPTAEALLRCYPSGSVRGAALTAVAARWAAGRSWLPRSTHQAVSERRL